MPRSGVVTVNDVLDGHVVLDLECLDRIYLNAYIPNLQVGGQVVSFLTAHLGNPVPSPAIFEKIGLAFRRAVAQFARGDHIPVVRGELTLSVAPVTGLTEPGQPVSRYVCAVQRMR